LHDLTRQFELCDAQILYFQWITKGRQIHAAGALVQDLKSHIHRKLAAGIFSKTINQKSIKKGKRALSKDGALALCFCAL